MSLPKLRVVRLYDGPMDGGMSAASGSVAWHQGECYVWDGGQNPDRFQHLTAFLEKHVDFMKERPVDIVQKEAKAVFEWMKDLNFAIDNAKPWPSSGKLTGILPMNCHFWIIAFSNQHPYALQQIGLHA